jgi:hypothetical protein
MAIRSALLSLGALLGCAHAGTMDCGEGVGLCGTLVLESGFGTGNYNHPEVELTKVRRSLSPCCMMIDNNPKQM